MPVIRYRISLLEYKDCSLRLTVRQLHKVLKAYRKKALIANKCEICQKKLLFSGINFVLCCGQFYFENKQYYRLRSIAVSTPGYNFASNQLKRMIREARIDTNQDFFVLPDPIYWQMQTTLIYDNIAKFVSGKPMSRRTKNVQPPSNAPKFYKQILEAPLNYGSLQSRSRGKATFVRQIAFGKRCSYSMRGMIVCDATLKPNEIRLPDFIVVKFNLRNKWVILNRMPTLQPENCVALKVPEASWPYDCFGIPLEILNSINGDFDGDEVNIYLFFSHMSQAECATILNPEWEMGSFVMGLKLHPCQDMLLAYYKYFDKIDFLPYKDRDLVTTVRVIFEVFGSKAAFDAFDNLRKFYLDKFENDDIPSITLEEINWLIKTLAEGGDISKGTGYLVLQTLAKAKCNFELIGQMFGCVGWQNNFYVKSSFWSGLTPEEAVAHAFTTFEALGQGSNVWQPGYGHNKIIYNLQGLIVDYTCRLIDGKDRVIEQDVLNAVHPTDVISTATVKFLVDEVLVGKNFELAKVD